MIRLGWRMSHNNPCIWQLSQRWRGRPVDVDGDEERRSGGVALLGDALRSEDTDTDVAPANGSEDVRDTAEGTVGDADGLVDDASDDASTAVAPPAGVDTPEVTEDAEQPAGTAPTDEVLTDEAPSADDGAPPVDDVAADVSPEEADGSGPVDGAEAEAAVAPVKPVRRKWSLRRGAAVAAVVLAMALAVSAFATSGSPSTTGDQHFLDTARSQGSVIAPGQQEGLLVSAAHKICDRRESHSTTAERRATALSTDELDAVSQSFGGDSRAFTTLALDTYCSS
jgi:hypothetical protein